MGNEPIKAETTKYVDPMERKKQLEELYGNGKTIGNNNFYETKWSDGSIFTKSVTIFQGKKVIVCDVYQPNGMQYTSYEYENGNKRFAIFNKETGQNAIDFNDNGFVDNNELM